MYSSSLPSTVVFSRLLIWSEQVGYVLMFVGEIKAVFSPVLLKGFIFFLCISKSKHKHFSEAGSLQ